jgi:SseB protein N-terminal domain
MRNAELAANYSGAVPSISGPDPSLRDDDGSADPGVAEVLQAFAAGRGSERAALTTLASSRLLVPVVATLTEQNGPGEKAAEMAMPTLIGLDGRRAIPAFTCLDSMRRWRADARPVPVAAGHLWRAATADGCAVVIDVAGPVPLAVEGARLAALADGQPVPAPCADSDVHEIVADVLAGQLAVRGFELRPGGQEHDLVIALTLSGDSAGHDVTDLATGLGNAVMARLGGRLRRGIAIFLGGAAGPGERPPGTPRAGAPA